MLTGFRHTRTNETIWRRSNAKVAAEKFIIESNIETKTGTECSKAFGVGIQISGNTRLAFDLLEILAFAVISPSLVRNPGKGIA